MMSKLTEQNDGQALSQTKWNALGHATQMVTGRHNAAARAARTRIIMNIFS